MFGNKQSSLQVRIDELEEQAETYNSTISTLMEDNASYKRTIASFVNVKASYEAEKEKMMKEHAAKVKVLEDKLVKTEKSVNQKVNESLTRIGVSVFPTENTLTNPSSSPSEIMETFNGLQGGEKTVYYNKHKAELNKALGIA